MRFKVALLILLMGTPVIAHAQSFGDLMGQAVKAKNAGNFEQCLEYLEQALPLGSDEDAPAILNNIGRIQELLGRYSAAFQTYSKVMNDSRTPADMKNINAARMISIQGKLKSAWLVGALEPQSAQFWLQGASVTLGEPSGNEVELVGGQGVLEGFDSQNSLTSLRFLTLPIGQRSSVNETLSTQGERDGVLSLIKTSRAGAELSIDGYALRSDLEAVHKIRLLEGTYTLDFRNADQKVTTLNLELAAGSETSLEVLLEAHKQEREAKAAALLARQESTDTGSILPWILTGSGVLLAGAGGFYLWKADDERSEITSAADEFGVIVGLTEAEAIEINEQADTYELAGTVLLGWGAAMIVGGVVTWLLNESTDDDAPSTTFWITPGSSPEVGVGVRF